MRPALNGPLFVIGLVGLLAAGWRSLEDDLTRVALLWLAPLVGLFGFLAGFTYPYYRFFNTTLAWVLLVGIGAGIAIRFFLDRAAAGGIQRLALLGVVAVVVVLATNLTQGFDISGWTKPQSQWLEPEARRDLDVLRQQLAFEDQDRPVVFVIDDEPPEPFQIYGFSKLSGNTSRYGLPPGQIDKGYLYLGSVEKLLADEPTSTGDDTYDSLSKDLLADTEAGIQSANQAPVIVVAAILNPAGVNHAVASGEQELDYRTGLELAEGLGLNTKVLSLHDGQVFELTTEGAVPMQSSDLVEEDPGPLHIPRVLLGLVLLLLPGYLALRYVLPDAGIAEGLGLVPALAIAITSLVGIIVIAVTRSSFGSTSAWTTLAVAIAASVALRSVQRPRAA
jgi:hypothetical protein